MQGNIYPCDYCDKNTPSKCHSNDCTSWRIWFLKEWDYTIENFKEKYGIKD